MISNSKQAIIIGETKLCTQCAKYLVNNGWQVIYVVSDDRVVIDWAKSESISVLPPYRLNTIETKSDFYLFSIINPYLIPETFLTNKNLILALNYHDSLLPKYAGVNSTTWAIINNEKQHGVTLHKIVTGIDEGDIAAQSAIAIEKDETAMSLNLKTSERLLSLFREIVDKIEAGNLKFSKQQLKDKTYYGLKHLPDNYGIINGTKDLATLYRLNRGLTFGEGYENPVATIKVQLKDKFYIGEGFNDSIIQKNHKIFKNTILFNKLRDIYGNEVISQLKYKDILKKYSLSQDDLKYLSSLKIKENKYKKEIREFLENHSEAVIQPLGVVSNKFSAKSYIKEVKVSKQLSTNTLLALVCFILTRFFRDNCIVSLYLSEASIPKKLRGLVEARNLIYLDQNLLNNSFTSLENYLTQLQDSPYILTKDFNYRYNIEFLTDIAITVGEVTSTNKHRMVIKIKKNKIEIQGDKSCQLPIDSILKAIATLLAKGMQKEIATKDLRHINLLNKAQYNQIVYSWNKTDRDYPKDKTVHQLFEEQVLKTPDNIALVCEKKRLSYKELNDKANEMARFLHDDYAVKPDDLVALFLDVNETMIIAMLGVLKSGGAYIPIDPKYPDERISYILNDAKTKVIFTNGKHKDRLQQMVSQKNINANIAVIDSKTIQDKLAKKEKINFITSATSTNLVYVLYTSGTTGNPKGVMIEHRGVVSLVKNTEDANYISVKTSDSFIQFCDIGFDFSAFEIWTPLLHGAKLVIPANKMRLFSNIKLFRKELITHKITTILLTKTLFDQLFLFDNKVFDGIKYVLVGGEALSKHLIEKLVRSNHRPKNVINAYGPTENSIICCTLNVTKKNLADVETVPIGVPLANRKAYILDKYLNPLPMGALGELYVAGAGIARGYLNKPDLTAERFIDNPLQLPKENLKNLRTKLYKTGDLVRWLSDGNLEYIGRYDDQIKIRGFRVELGDIESKLLDYPSIKQAVVIVREKENNKYLVAYYVASNELESSKLQNYLLSQLPDYMVPNVFVYMQSLPLMENGKLDRKALPAPSLISQAEYVAPKSELEKTICGMYAKVLQLPAEKVGIRNDFFNMGGDSISAIQLVAEIRQFLGLNISINDVFKHRNVEQLVTSILTSKKIQKEDANIIEQQVDEKALDQKYLNKIEKNINVEAVYLANNLQQGFIYHAIKHNRTDDAYISQFIWQYKVSVNKDKLIEAWQLVQKKYPSLRLRFAWDNEPIQIIEKNQKLDFRYIDLTKSGINSYNKHKTAKSKGEAQGAHIIEKDRREYYDLQKGNLIRIYLLKLSATRYTCICSVHHIILDGWSLSLLFNAVHGIYGQLLNDKRPQITEDVTYKKAQEYLQKHKNGDKDYWRNYIKQIEDRVDLKSLLKPLVQGIEIKNHTQIEQELEQYLEITGQKLNKLKDFCRANAVTINTVIQYAWHKILHIYGACNTTVVGTIVTGRNIPLDNIENSVGLFINTLPLIYSHNHEPDGLVEQIKTLQHSINEINSKSNINLANLQPEGERLFDSLIGYENYPPPKSIGNIKYTNIQENFKIDYPLAIVAYEKNQSLIIKLKYAGELFSKETIAKLLDKLLFFIDQVLENPHQKVLKYITQDEYQQLVINFNKTAADYPANKTIHQLFEEQVLKTPNNLAVVFEDKKLTYKELNKKANQLANYLLRNVNIKPDDLIAIILNKSEYLIISILAILKTGAAYVPIDPNYPDDRIKYILNDTKAKAIIKGSGIEYKMQHEILKIEEKELQQIFSKEDTLNPKTEVISNNLAYVIYTSGTTGNPKGVMIEHEGVVNYVSYLIKANKLNHQSRGSQYANFSFDATVIEIYPMLLSGGALYIIKDSDKLDPAEINSFFTRNSITYAFLPTVFAEMFSELKNLSLKNLIVGGDKLKTFTLQSYQVINAYGPTETTVQSNRFIVKRQYQNIPIGKPISNVTNYILDKKLNILPIGTVGELYIGGAGVASGYLNQPQLTMEKFISNPFQTEKERTQGRNSRLYKTGDLVRMRPDGNLEFIGRDDDQIKIRGIRVEIGEIESKLLKYPGIKQTSMLTKERADGTDKYLVAYYVADRELEEEKILNFLAAQLPKHMLPQMLVYLDKLPLTASGKLNRNALPISEFTISSNYVAPKTRLQNQMVDIWSRVLNIPKKIIGITNSFLNLGGNSILVIKLASQLSKIRGCKNIKVIDIFEHTTIEQLSEYVEQKNFKKDIIVVRSKNKIETDIAIIAMSGAFSGCENIDQYWNLILSGSEGITDHSLEECKKFTISEDILSNPNFISASGHVPNIDKFDVAFWGLPPNEVKSLDPQVRKFIEHCWYLLEISGYLPIRSKTNIGVFAGGGNNSYFINNKLPLTNKLFSAREISQLSTKDILATKASFLLGLTGVSNNISTACSTSLVAVIEACIYLASNYCDMAIAGGTSLLMPEEVGHVYQEGMIYSKEKHCRVFDDKASGVIQGSGVGVVLLKRLSDAKKDGDNIIAIIKGYAVNNDGNRKETYTAPSAIGQKECIINAQKMAKITSDCLDYIECHGTGTRLGDPIEIHALDEAFKYNINQNNLQRKCIIGSVKANIGHADSAAGIAGLIKVCQMLEHKVIPGQINYDIPNAELCLDDTNFQIITKLRKWSKTNGIPRLAGVSSFGIGGTNAHLIISEYTPDIQEGSIKDKFLKEASNNYILPFSAKTPSSLEAYMKDFKNYLADTKYHISNIAYTLQLKRENFDYRTSIVASSINDAIGKLKTNISVNKVDRQKRFNVIFMFPGQGNQYSNMSLDLYLHDVGYRDTVNKCIKIINNNTKIQFKKILFPMLFYNETTNYDINHAKWAQISLFVVEYSLAKMLENLSVNAACYIGHSIGEYVAATLAGVFSLEDAIKLIITRGQLMHEMPTGSMLSILDNAAKVEKIIKSNGCEIAVINSPKNCVASGRPQAIRKLKSSLNKLGLQSIILQTSHAYHSRFMLEAAKKFIDKFNLIELNKPHKEFISNISGNFITMDKAINPEYWAKHMVKPVLFAEGIKKLFSSYNNLFFIEVGPGKSSISFVKHCNISGYNTVQLLNSQSEENEKKKNIYCKENILSKLWAGGYHIDFKSYCGYSGNEKIVKLPSYHFDQLPYWIDRSWYINTAKSEINLSETITDITEIKNRVIEQDLPDKYYEIAKTFLQLLGIERISIHDDFFKLGGDSLLAVSLVTKLQHNYQINVTDIFNLKTIAKIAESVLFIKDNLFQKFEQIKSIYRKKMICLAGDKSDLLLKEKKYLQGVGDFAFKKQEKDTCNILLTGSTGHVGCNILYHLLHKTSHKIYLLVRASSVEEANKRVNHKFKYYFDTDLGFYKARVTILVADIEQPLLGLNKAQYDGLMKNIDSIIHSAALVKHYGDYSNFYKANVTATINLLDLAKQTSKKDFHYISSLAILFDGYIPNRSCYMFDEDDTGSILFERNNVYAKTKYEGELIVNEYRAYGVASSIYRLGNVAMSSNTHRHQTNIEDNAFFITTKAILNLGIIANEINIVEISPVDSVASAIVKLFNQAYLSNITYHLFNPSRYKLSQLLSETQNAPIKTCSIDNFFDVISMKSKTGIDRKLIELFMLHQQWLQSINLENLTDISVVNCKTEKILSNLDFTWPKITKDMMLDMIKIPI